MSPSRERTPPFAGPAFARRARSWRLVGGVLALVFLAACDPAPKDAVRQILHQQQTGDDLSQEGPDGLPPVATLDIGTLGTSSFVVNTQFNGLQATQSAPPPPPPSTGGSLGGFGFPLFNFFGAN